MRLWILEESSATAGSEWIWYCSQDTLPLLRGAVLAGWVYVFVVSFRELSSVIRKITPRNQVLPTVLWDLFINGSVELRCGEHLVDHILMAIVISATLLFKIKLR